MILRSSFSQAPDYPFVCYLTKGEKIPLFAELRETFGPGGLLPFGERNWISGMARSEVLQAESDDVFLRCVGDYVAFKTLEDQVLFRLKYEGRKTV